MGQLTTHILNTAAGRPASGMRIDVCARHDSDTVTTIKSLVANDDGRTPAPLLAGDEFKAGRYRLIFYVADYFRHVGHADAGVFLDTVPIDFVIADPTAKYHVPLLVSPWSYATYRGS